ncbi:MAG: betaine-aldehyde dehydrogenase, partial [Fuerstiella sp.]|nr:betaine-aldehyde dehydrogenase [Fuerstiella sp.]
MSTATDTTEGLLAEVSEFLSTDLQKASLNGEWVEASAGQTFDGVDPGTGQKISTG